MTEQDLSASSAPKQSDGVAKEDRSEKPKPVPPKVFVHRNSVLTDLMEVNHLQTVYNISVAVCFLLIFTTVLYYVVDQKKFREDMKIMYWGAGKLHIFAAIWLGLSMACISVHQAFCMWANMRHKLLTKLMDLSFILFFVFIIILMFTATPYVVRKTELPPITAFAILAEMARMFMKVYSFVRESYPRVRKAKTGVDHVEKMFPFQHFLYYLLAPVLLYRDSYPRSKELHWKIVFFNFLKVVACIFISHCLFHVFITDTFKNVGHKPFHLPQLVLVFAGSMVVGSIMMFLIFYAILHSWLNAFAEMLRFGDRQFYTDWWNSTSFAQYYRRWNSVVYDWLYIYIHEEMNRMGFSRTFSLVTVFVVSAAVHEYIICFALGFFFPALAIAYSMIGVPILFITRKRTAQTWNTFMWGMLFLGWGVLIMAYSLEWYARKNCPRLEDYVMDALIPRFVTCGILAPA